MDRLLLLSGNDIPLMGVGLQLHPPKLKEIAYLGETKFFSGLELLKFSKKSLKMDKNQLEVLTDFDIIMKIMEDKSQDFKEIRENVLLVLFLLFPKYSINFNFQKNQIEFLEEEKETRYLNKLNYKYFKETLIELFPLEEKSQDFNPSGDLSKKIAEKLEKRKKRLAELKHEITEIDILSRYASILAIGLQIDLNDIMNYTVYQLFDNQKRFNLKSVYDATVQAKLAGCSDIPEAKSWMEDLYTKDINK